MTDVPLLSGDDTHILSDANDSNDVALFVATGCSIEQHFDARARLGDQRELKVFCFWSLQGSIKDCLDSSLVVICDKFFYKRTTWKCKKENNNILSMIRFLGKK